MASVNDRITDTRNAARPVSTTVGSTRSIGGTTLSCASLAGWPTASKVHFVTYQIDTNNNPLPNTQMDWYGIVSGSDIGSLTLVDGVSGNDIGNSVGDIVEMLPTAAWGQDLADALLEEHDRTGAHGAVTATSVDSSSFVKADTISEHTGAAGVTVDGLLIKDGTPRALDKSTLSTDSNPYKFSAYRNAAFTTGTPSVIEFDTELFDTNSNFDTVTNKGRYTVPVTGFYWFSAGATINPPSGNGSIIYLYKNGGIALQGSGSISFAGPFNNTQVVSGLLQLTAGDYVEVYYYGSGNALGIGSAQNYFHGFLVSRS